MAKVLSDVYAYGTAYWGGDGNHIPLEQVFKPVVWS